MVNSIIKVNIVRFKNDSRLDGFKSALGVRFFKKHLEV